MARTLLASVLGLLIAGPAFAQPAKNQPAPAPPAGSPDKPAPDGKEVELPEDSAPSADPSGVNENPDAPRGMPGAGVGVTVAPPPPPEKVRKGYPIEETLRPITLPALTSEAAFDVRNNIRPYATNTTLRGRFGITRQWQIGLEYNIGGFYDDPGTVSEDKVKFNTGKSIGLDVTYLLFNWMGLRAALPFYLDPFAMGITLGAPMKFRITDKFAFGGFGDFLSIKIAKFVPSTQNELFNELNAIASDSGSVESAGAIQVSGFATYQVKPNIAIGGDLGIHFEDFSDREVPYSLRFRGQYSTSNKLDFGGAMGFGDLGDASHSFQLNLYAQLRI
jgi:hypothetical protein